MINELVCIWIFIFILCLQGFLFGRHLIKLGRRLNIVIDSVIKIQLRESERNIAKAEALLKRSAGGNGNGDNIA